MKAGNGGPKVGKDSPTGNLQSKNASEANRFFGRKIKSAGSESNPAAAFRMNAVRKANDYND